MNSTFQFADIGNIFIIFYVVLFGLCIGSFLNVAILRGLKGEDIIFGRSRCPKCSNKLKWYMNIPLLSYIFLKGRCAYCKTKISIQYPIVEALCAVCFLLCYLNFSLTYKTLFMFIFFATFILMIVTDILQTVIIDYHAYILAFFALLYSLLGLNDITFVQSILGAVFGFLIFEIMAKIPKYFLGVRMFGEGDSLIALGLGAIFGIKNLVFVIVLSIIIQAICAIPFLAHSALKKHNKKLFLSYCFTLFSIILVLFLNYFNLIYYPIYYFLSLILILAMLIFALKNIINDIKEKKKNMADDSKQMPQEGFNLMPFGPALLISAALCIFYMNEIKLIISRIFISN